MNAPNSNVLMCDEIATYWRVSVDRVWALIRSGELKAFRIGREYRITQEDFQEFLNRRSNQPQS